VTWPCVAQAVSHRLPTAAVPVRAQVKSSECFRFLYHSFVPPSPPQSSLYIILGWYNGAINGRRSSALGSTPVPYKTNSVALSLRANYTDWSTATGQLILVPTSVDRGVSRGQHGRTPTAVNLSFLERNRYFFFQVAPHLCSQELSGLRSRPTATQKIWYINKINLWRMVSSGMLRRVVLVRTDVSEELSASFNKVTRIGELGTTLAVTNNRRTLGRNTNLVFLRWFLQEPRGVTSQKTPFFIVTVVKTSNLTR
jgi:hypothetical protein